MSLPSEKDDDFEDVQRAGPMLLESIEFSSVSANSVQRGQNVIDNSQERLIHSLKSTGAISPKFSCKLNSTSRIIKYVFM